MTKLRIFCLLVFANFGVLAAHNVPRWQRFELSLDSTATYTNPVQQAALTATFNAPSGQKHKVYGFWDGEKKWKVRFAPNEKGKWTYQTECSDSANKGLHAQRGELTCTDPSGDSRF